MSFPTPNGERTFVDPNGDPYVGGLVFSYVPGTTTPSPTYADEGLTVVNPNPIVLDAAGRCVMWTDLLTRQVVHDMFGNLVWDQETGIVIDNIPGNLHIGGNLTVDGNSQFNGTGTFNGLLTANGGETVNGPFTATGGATITGGLNTDNINNSGNINTNTIDASGLITAGGGLTANGPITANGGITAPGGFAGNIVANAGFCVVTDCIDPLTANPGYVTVNGSMIVKESAASLPNGALIVESIDPQSYTDFYGRGIMIVSNDNPYIALYNTFGPFLPWVMWGGTEAFNWGLSNANNGDPSAAGSQQLMSLDSSGNLTIVGTLTQGAVSLSAQASSFMSSGGALAFIDATPVEDMPKIDALAILWMAVQELSAQVTK